MALTLEVISSHRATLGDDGVRVFTVHGGSIGRSVDNDWVLPDPERFVSARHATVQSQKGQFFIIDTSTNGVFLNDSSVPVGRGNYERLRHGDKLRIGRYEISVQMTGEDADGQAPSPQMPLAKKDQLLSLAALIQDDLAHGTDTESNLEDEITELRDTPGGQVAPDVRGNSGDWNLIHVPGTGERPRLDISPADALARGIRTGDRVCVHNERGRLELEARVDFGLREGCVSVTNGWWIPEGGTVNFLSLGRETDLGHGAAFHDNLVDVERLG